MKYFLLETNKGITHLPQLIDWHRKIDDRNLHIESAYKLADKIIIFVKGKEDTFYPDIISKPALLMSKAAKEVVMMYEPRTIWKNIILLDKENENLERYFLPVFEEVYCLDQESVYNMDQSNLKKIILDAATVKEHNIFRIAGVGGQYIVANLDIVESMLKRGMRGMGVTELPVVTTV